MQSMTNLPVAGVHLRIEEVYTPEEVAERQPSLPDPENHSQVAGELPE